MYTAKIENSDGDVLTLNNQEPNFQVINITGLNPPTAQINTTTIVGLDGAVFNSSKLQPRNIVIMLKLNGNVEQNRLLIYSFFKTKDWCKFYYINGSRDVFIEGYVQNVECDLFSDSETAQISVICPYPYFKSNFQNVVESSDVEPLFTFPFSINQNEPVIISSLNILNAIMVDNSSEAEAGTLIEIDVTEGFRSIEIKNTKTGEDFELDYEFEADDKILIDTNKGQKSVNLIRDGVITNIFSSIKIGSVFFQLTPGENVFKYLIDGETNNTSVYIVFRYNNVYRGV